ncbi:hypothetical protein MVEN_00092200 [Mycena venus]|uniref:Uncharacterized protein n=1 Tax=Mycena venus TaxID=2733690 RepID=A0A8H6ZAU5_9AGAR|nr:hypothetical protein MVEN_00092200 [Mycena venus]
MFNDTEQMKFTLDLLQPSLSALLTDASRTQLTHAAWINLNEYEIYNILSSMLFRGDCLTEFLVGRLVESIVGKADARRLEKLFPSPQKLSQSLEIVRDTKEAWCSGHDLPSFISKTLSQLNLLGPPTFGKIGAEHHTSPPSDLLLSEEKIRKLRVRDIHDQLDMHRRLWRPGMTVIPKNYLLRNKAAKLDALLLAVSEYLEYTSRESENDDSITLGANSRRNSAQMLDFDKQDDF